MQRVEIGKGNIYQMDGADIVLYGSGGGGPSNWRYLKDDAAIVATHLGKKVRVVLEFEEDEE